MCSTPGIPIIYTASFAAPKPRNTIPPSLALACSILKEQLVLEDGGGMLLENSDTVTGVYEYVILESDDYNLATQTRDYADNTTYESDAGFGTESTADDILDFTERNPFGEVDE